MVTLQQYEESVHAPPAAHKKPLSCQSQVVLGSPSTGCGGVGICKMYLSKTPVQISCPSMKSRLIKTENGRLRIRFDRAKMESRYLKRHFRWNLFQVVEPFELPDWACRKIELTPCRIAPGIYTVWETEEAFIVDF